MIQIIWRAQKWNWNSKKRFLLHFLATLEFIRVGTTTRDGSLWSPIRICALIVSYTGSSTQCNTTLPSSSASQQVFREEGRTDDDEEIWIRSSVSLQLFVLPQTKPNHHTNTIASLASLIEFHFMFICKTLWSACSEGGRAMTVIFPWKPSVCLSSCVLKILARGRM